MLATPFNPSLMALTNFSRGIASFGCPVIPGDSTVSTGNVFFVDSVHGNAQNSGTSTDNALTTITLALALCTAANGDTIFVMPGHAETLTAAGTITCNKSGVRIVGLGQGRNRPVISYSTAVAASFNITAANTTIDNLVFDMTGVDAVTAGINVSAADVTIKNCEMEVANASGQATLGILTTAAANRLTIQNNWIHGTTDAGLSVAIRIVGGLGVRILNNVIDVAGTTTLGCIQNVTTAATQMVIDGNILNNSTAVSTVVITLVSTTTGAVTNNRMGILNGTAPIVGAALNLVGGNYYAAAAGVTAGTLI